VRQDVLVSLEADQVDKAYQIVQYFSLMKDVISEGLRVLRVF